MFETTSNGGRWPTRVLLLFEGSSFGGDFDEAIMAGFAANGCQVDTLSKGQAWPPDYDLVIGYGPFKADEGHLLTLANQVAATPRSRRPVFVWWLTENPPAGLPLSLYRPLASARLHLDQMVGIESGRSYGRLRTTALKGHRLRILGQVLKVKEAGILDLLVSTSTARARFYRQLGIEALVAPLPYHEVYGQDLSLRRDVDITFLGNARDPRRARILPWLVTELRHRGLTLRVETHLYGDERKHLLNRTKILVNVLRAPQDFVGQRLLLGAANKALVVSEAMLDPSPFIPGRHFVSGKLKQLPELVAHFLYDEAARLTITSEAYRFVQEDLSAERTVARIIEHARAEHNAHAAERI